MIQLVIGMVIVEGASSSSYSWSMQQKQKRSQDEVLRTIKLDTELMTIAV